MTRQVLSTDRFDRDVGEQIAWLIATERASWIEPLADDIRRLATLLAEYPSVGRIIELRGRQELRRVQLRTAPFRALYLVDLEDDAAPITLLRLFHVRQRMGRA